MINKNILHYIKNDQLFKKYITFVLFLIVLTCSIITRLANLDQPNSYIFDESYYIPMAQKYKAGEFYGDPHPPLGRLIITVSGVVFSGHNNITEEDNEYKVPPEEIVNYRILPALFNTLIPVLVFLIILYITKSNIFAFLGALLITFDNALVVHSRYALFDGIMTFFVLTSLLFSMLYAKSSNRKITGFSFLIKRFILLTFAGLFAGAAVATKFNGLTASGILLFAILYRTYKDKINLKKIKSHLLILSQIIVSIVSILTIFLFSYWAHFGLLNIPGDSLEEYSEEFQSCFQGDESDCKLSLLEKTTTSVKWSMNYNKHIGPLNLCKEGGEIGSAPYHWPFMARAIPMYFDSHGQTPLKTVSYIYLSGNPLVWISGLIGVLTALSLTISSIFYGKAFVSKEILFCFFLYLMHYLPYFLISRVMYFYHYFPALIFSIILLSVVIEKLYKIHINSRLKKILALVFFLIYISSILIVFFVYAPISYNKKISKSYMDGIILVKFWNLRSDPFNYEELSE